MIAPLTDTPETAMRTRLLIASILMLGCTVCAAFAFLATSAQDEWLAIRLQEMSSVGMLDVDGVNSVLERDGKTYRLDPLTGVSGAYPALARDYLLEGTAMPNVRRSSFVFGLLSLATGVLTASAAVRLPAARAVGCASATSER